MKRMNKVGGNTVALFTFLNVRVKIEDAVKVEILDVDDQLDNHNSAAL